jgi:iron complex transport system substrate-binding protein
VAYGRKAYGLAFFARPVLLVCLIGFGPLLGREAASAAGSRERPQVQQATAGAEAAQEAEAESLSGEGFPVTLVDDAGVAVVVERRPQRIVSLTSFTDEILLDLVSVERLIAVTVFSQDPDISNVVDKALPVPHKLQLNVEVILTLRPDLLFVANWTDASEVAQLRGSGIPVYLLATGVTVEEIERKIRAVARLVGEAQRGQAMVQDMERRLAQVASRVSRIPPDKRLRVMDYTTWGSAQGRGSSWDEIVRHAGLINAVGEYPADKFGQVALSKEMILRLNPDMLILPGWVYGKPAGAQSFYDSIVNDPALRNLTAVRRGRVYRMPEGLRAAASQYIVDAVEYLSRLAYPELWRN